MATLTVGVGKEFSTISAAVAASQSGDTIDVDAGTYTNDFPPGITHDLTLVGVGGMVKMVATVEVPNQKGILDVGQPGITVSISNFDISGATVSSDSGNNGSGIRYEGGNLILNNDYIHDNQEGLLSAADPAGNITIENSTFQSNGNGDGFTHNIYVGAIDTLTIDNSYFLSANLGHEIKSLAANTSITNSYIEDGSSTASYSIDLPNGGNVTIMNNEIEKGENSQNPVMISYGESGSAYANSSLTVSGNTILYDDAIHSTSTAVRNSTSIVATVSDNQVYGLTESQIATGPATESNNTILTTEPALATSPICFFQGTHVMAERGEVLVEELARGERVLTSTGALVQIDWIGRQTVRLQFADAPRVLPIRIKAGALGLQKPARDLLVSPDHALLVDGILVQASSLINGVSIVQESDVLETFTYYHLELPAHALIFAENTLAESFIDNVDRARFDNVREYRALFPHRERGAEMDYPRAKSARQVPIALRQRLLARGQALYGNWPQTPKSAAVPQFA